MIALSTSILRRLTEKSLDPSDPNGEGSIPPEILPTKESVLVALQMQAQEWAKEGVLSDLVEYASLGDRNLGRYRR